MKGTTLGRVETQGVFTFAGIVFVKCSYSPIDMGNGEEFIGCHPQGRTETVYVTAAAWVERVENV